MFRKLATPILILFTFLIAPHSLSLAAVHAGFTTRLSIASDGTQGNNTSEMPAISADGRFVAFVSYANNLVSGDTNNVTDIFVHDRQTGLTRPVSVSSDSVLGNNYSFRPSISADGRFVAFQSSATNLVSVDTNGISNVFIHDRQTGQTELISKSIDGAPTNGDSYMPSVSADGRLVAFESYASNLVSEDTSYWNIFVSDRLTGQIELISRSIDGAPADNGSGDPFISPDGRFVVFQSAASNLISGDTNQDSDIFIHDRQTGQMELVSVASDGAQADDWSWKPSISANGRFVVFASHASNLVSGDTNYYEDVFVHDRGTGQTRRVSISSDGTQADNWSESPAISADGRFVAFMSDADNLVSNDTNIDVDIFVRDLQTGQTERVSVTSDGVQGDGNSLDPSISAAGQFVAYFSNSTNLVEGDTNGNQDVFLFENTSDAIFDNRVYLPLAFRDELLAIGK